jgi:hypothetical protein
MSVSDTSLRGVNSTVCFLLSISHISHSCESWPPEMA